MALRIKSFYPATIVIDGEFVNLRITRMNPEQALDFNQKFTSFGSAALNASNQKPASDETDPIAAAAKAAEEERATKRFVVEAISSYVKLEPDQIYEDDSEESITSGADLCRLFGARDEVLSEFLLHIFMENKMNNEQKDQWKAKNNLAPFVPTPAIVAERMMENANVGPDDLVYDLGCGTGALCIAAAKRGAKAVGFDTNKERVALATAAAKEAGLSDLCSFEVKDALTVDLTKPSVVAVYLLSGSLAKLRGSFEEHLPVGARIVSHAFTMGGGWETQSAEFVKPADGDELAHSGANWVYTYDVDRRRGKTKDA